LIYGIVTSVLVGRILPHNDVPFILTYLIAVDEKRAHIHRIIVVFSEIGCPSFYVNHIP
jgi:hypothetical protein